MSAEQKKTDIYCRKCCGKTGGGAEILIGTDRTGNPACAGCFFSEGDGGYGGQLFPSLPNPGILPNLVIPLPAASPYHVHRENENISLDALFETCLNIPDVSRRR